MLNIFKYGPPQKMVKAMLWFSWPIIKAAKILSPYPPFKWIINPFFSHPGNEVTVVPINEAVIPPESLVLPRRVVERFVSQVKDIFILDKCICRDKEGCTAYPHDIGCMGLGEPVRRIHPSHGRRVSGEEALEHVRKAAKAGLVANVAHTWIDPVAFGLTNFRKLMFICYCCDCCCIYRKYLKKRGPNLDTAYQGLPGISIDVDPQKCTGCGECVEHCFVASMSLVEGVASPGDQCRGCGRCVEICPEGALTLSLENEEALYEQLMDYVNGVSDIMAGSKGHAIP